MMTKNILFTFFLIFCSILVFSQGMIIQSKANVTVANGGKIIITDATNGMLTIKSDASGTGSLVVDGNAASQVSVAAHANMERYLTGNNAPGTTDWWHLVSSPMTNALSGSFLGDYLLSYSEPTNTFSYIVPTNVPLIPMEGYEAWAWVPVGKTDVLSGTLNNGTQSFYMTRTDVPPSFGYNGWNLLGNPYPCAIDFDALSGWDFGDADQTVYISNTGAGVNFPGTFATHVRNGASTNGGSQYIPAEQGFFMHCGNSFGTNVTMNNNVRVHSAQSYYKSTETDPVNILRLTASGNNYRNETVIDFDPSASSSFDRLDALYYNGSAGVPKIYSTLTGDTSLCINTLPRIVDNLTVPVGFKVSEPGTYSITASQAETFSHDVFILLFDQKTKIHQNLMNFPVYTFTADSSDNANRFLVIFGILPNGIGTSAANENVRIYSWADAVFIQTPSEANATGPVFIYDPVGREQYRGNLSGTDLTRINPDLNTGYYVVKVITSGSTSLKKVFISR